jgi:hypothetical protein
VNSTIADRILQIKQELPKTVKLIAVSKYASVEAMREAYQAGIRDFGESRVLEAIAKKQELQDLPDITWHMIGTLQSNKARQALLNFDWIHSVDRLSLAQQLNRLAIETNTQISICLQVKLADDPSKSGWSEQELIDNLASLAQCQAIQIKGLMTILPLGLTPQQSLNIFQKVAALKNRLNSQGWQNIKELSMGMSQDYDLAVKAGATMIRIGSKVFG